VLRSYRDKKVVGVFVRFSATMHTKLFISTIKKLTAAVFPYPEMADHMVRQRWINGILMKFIL
jgi:hypothetical protein